MRVVFHIISTGGGGSGSSRTTRYIAERDKDAEREGPGARPLFSKDRENLTYRKADRILDPIEGQPDKSDLIHISVSFEEEDFEKLGAYEKERQRRLQEVIREGMKGMAEELNVEKLTWIAGIHRNSDNPHAHVVISKDVAERGTGREKRIGRIRRSLLPHKEIENGLETIVPGKIGEKFLASLDRQQSLHLGRDNEREIALQAWERLVQKKQERSGHESSRDSTRSTNELVKGDSSDTIRSSRRSDRQSRPDLDQTQIAVSWNAHLQQSEMGSSRYRIALGKQFEMSARLVFTQVWYDRAVERGDTYRFNVLDKSTEEERKISELDVRRRAAARATRLSQGNPALREGAFEADLYRHTETLRDLAEVRDAKIAALAKDIAGLSSKLSRTNSTVVAAWQPNLQEARTPLLSRDTLSELQDQAIRLDLSELTSELEKLRTTLALEHRAPTRTDDEVGKLAAQVNVARADLMAREARLDNLETSLHLTTYEVHDERWSLGTLDKRIARRIEDTKLIPEYAARLNLRSLARINYSSAAREQAAIDVQHLNFVRSEIVRQIEARRESLTQDRNSAREMLDVLEGIHRAEHDLRSREGKALPEPIYELYQIKSLETSAETLRDPTLLRQVHDLEKAAARSDSDVNWEGRAVAREIMAGLAVEEAKQRLEHFLESSKVASLHLGNHQTATMRDVEARNLTEYLARAILETREQRDHRQSVKSAARDHHGRLVNDFDKASSYHAAAREFSSEARGREPQFTDKEKINLEIYAERQNDEAQRERYLECARTESPGQDRQVSSSRER